MMVILAYPTYAAFGGPRLGLIGGVDFLQGRHWYTALSSNLSPSTDMVKRLSALSGSIGAYGGYLFELGAGAKIVLGGEVYFVQPSANSTVQLALLGHSTDGTVKIQHTQVMGFALTVGMMLNPRILVYASAGLETSKFKFTYQLNNLAPLPPNQVITHPYHPIVPTIGGEYKFTPQMLVGLQLSSPFYRHAYLIKGPLRLARYKPVERRLWVKLSYLF